MYGLLSHSVPLASLPSALSLIEKDVFARKINGIQLPTASRWDIVPQETLISINLINVQSKCNYELLSVSDLNANINVKTVITSKLNK